MFPEYVSDADMARQDAEVLRIAGDELAEKAEQLLEFTRERIATANDLHEVFELSEKLRQWRAITS